MHAEANHPPNGRKATDICVKMRKRSNAVYRSQDKPRKGGGDSGRKGKHGCPQPLCPKRGWLFGHSGVFGGCQGRAPAGLRCPGLSTAGRALRQRSAVGSACAPLKEVSGPGIVQTLCRQSHQTQRHCTALKIAAQFMGTIDGVQLAPRFIRCYYFMQLNYRPSLAQA